VIPAIANAVFDAIGVRIDETPITPEKVLRALKGKPAAVKPIEPPAQWPTRLITWSTAEMAEPPATS